jgi:flagellar capping protein FliD
LFKKLTFLALWLYAFCCAANFYEIHPKSITIIFCFQVEVTLSEKENQITMLYSDLENKNSQINSLEAQIKSMQERRAADNLMYLQQITEAKNFCLNMYNQLGGLENQLRSGDNSMNLRGL